MIKIIKKYELNIPDSKDTVEEYTINSKYCYIRCFGDGIRYSAYKYSLHAIKDVKGKRLEDHFVIKEKGREDTSGKSSELVFTVHLFEILKYLGIVAFKNEY